MTQQNRTIIVIGNGFDLNLGLPTSYQDFLNSPQFQQLLQTENQLFAYLKDKYDLQNWVDIENELQVYSRECTITDRNSFRIEHQKLCKCLCSYLNSIDYANINMDSFAYKTLSSFIKDEGVTLISFNYTDTINHIIREIHFSTSNDSIKLHHIHGNASNHNIVFGVEDQANINTNDVFLLKATQKAFNPIDLTKIFETAQNVIFLGHSLGSTDHHYFSSFFARQALNHATKKTIIITCYKEQGRLNIWKSIRKLTHNNPTEFQIRNDVHIVDLATI